MKKRIQSLIMVICIIVFIFFSYKIYNYNKEEKEQKKLIDNLIEIATIKNYVSNQASNEGGSNVTQNKLPIEIDFDILEKENRDIVAWIYSDGTPINYPIVQTKDNEYYLRRSLNRTYNQAGTIFMDYKNNSNFEDDNTIIYGHNMKNSTMFGTLTNYEKQEYFNEHPYMYLFTKQHNFKVELFAGYITNSESDIYSFPKNANTNKKDIQTAIQKSTFKSEIDVTNEDKIITLSTCSYNFENARYILLGVLREI